MKIVAGMFITNDVDTYEVIKIHGDTATVKYNGGTETQVRISTIETLINARQYRAIKKPTQRSKKHV